MELLDYEQIDVDESGPSRPRPAELATDLKQQWYASVEEEVKQQLAVREEELKARIEV